MRPDVIAAALLACLCADLLRIGRPVCRCVLHHGTTAPPMDACDCECPPVPPSGAAGQGQAWVRLASMSALPPTPESRAAEVTLWRATWEAGVYRCITTTPDGGPIDPAAANADATALLLDAAALARLVCCEALEGRDVQVSEWTPAGPAGGCAGGSIRISADL
ncbi:hypothetical protein [Bailinhaonella thermotolerans]|uniref:Uncharacterized protein n=1 Tax=Bailinhaonella thermotolerans TaxID=1070861 RepID=A0A3A3ZZ14_9ACTN|nr:hypothetical protein [Bailinhaonella thermotolerans]RJL19403.1 hypothetical protein D5H75_40395 [Bailinhaonella thermotolerans]